MGLTKWFIKNGPGSIGSIARFWTKQYIKTKQDHGHEMDEDEIFASLFISFRHGLRAVGKTTMNSDPEEIVTRCKGHLDKLLIYMILENTEYIKALHNNDKMLLTTLQVIVEIVEEQKINISSNWTQFDIIGIKVEVNYRQALLNMGRLV